MPARTSPVATLFPLLIVGLLAGMTYWLELATRQQTIGPDGKSRHDPDYIVDNFKVRRFDPEGALQHTLIAEQMRHYPDDDSTVVLAPRLTYHRSPPTYVEAREARLDSAGKHVELLEDVRVTRMGSGAKAETVLTTARLDAYPDDEIATTSVPVTITQGQSKVTGTALSVNNRVQTYILEGPVRGIFFRQSSPPAKIQPAANPQPLAKPAAKPKPLAKPKPKAASRKASKTPSKPKSPSGR